MKKFYEEPVAEVVSFQVEDIITTSGDDKTGEFDGEWVLPF